ncbi:MAG: glycosyltransferase [Rhizobiaceae bacterium]
MQTHSSFSLAVLLATYNGSAHVREQIESLAHQSGAEISLCVSDDGSSDNTRQIVESYKGDPRFKSVEICDGPQQGFAENFRHLILNAAEGFDCYAFSDQDDEWLPQKASKAFEALSSVAPGVAAVYCGRTEIMAEEGRVIGLSPLFPRSPGFRNAIVQSIAGGNTMVLNSVAMRLLKVACSRTDFIVHDWFCYQVISGSGGTIFYDPQPMVRYRQHGANLIGSNTGLSAKATRMRMLFSGRFANWNARNVAALEKLDDLMTPDSKMVLELFKIARTVSLPKRIQALRNAGIFRQTLFGTCSLFVACLFKKL